MDEPPTPARAGFGTRSIASCKLLHPPGAYASGSLTLRLVTARYTGRYEQNATTQARLNPTPQYSCRRWCRAAGFFHALQSLEQFADHLELGPLDPGRLFDLAVVLAVNLHYDRAVNSGMARPWVTIGVGRPEWSGIITCS